MAIDDNLMHMATLSADMVAIEFPGASMEMTKAIVRRTLESLEANGYIEIVPLQDRSPYFAPLPPYETPDHLAKPKEDNGR